MGEVDNHNHRIDSAAEVLEVQEEACDHRVVVVDTGGIPVQLVEEDNSEVGIADAHNVVHPEADEECTPVVDRQALVARMSE